MPRIFDNIEESLLPTLRIRVEIEAAHVKGFDEQVLRIARANCATLGFTNAEFGG